MTHEDRRQLLLQTGERYPSFLLHLIEKPPLKGGFHLPPVAAAPNWCICLKCRDMPKKVERICCGRPANHCQSQSLVSYHHFNMLTIITVTLLEVIILVGRFIKVICKFKNIHQFFSSSFYVDNIDT